MKQQAWCSGTPMLLTERSTTCPSIFKKAPEGIQRQSLCENIPWPCVRWARCGTAARAVDDGQNLQDTSLCVRALSMRGGGHIEACHVGGGSASKSKSGSSSSSSSPSADGEPSLISVERTTSETTEAPNMDQRPSHGRLPNICALAGFRGTHGRGREGYQHTHLMTSPSKPTCFLFGGEACCPRGQTLAALEDGRLPKRAAQYAHRPRRAEQKQLTHNHIMTASRQKRCRSTRYLSLALSKERGCSALPSRILSVAQRQTSHNTVYFTAHGPGGKRARLNFATELPG